MNGWLGTALRRMRPPRTLTLTRDGWWFCLGAVLVGLAAMNTGNNLLYLLLGMLLSLIIASGILSEMSLRGVVTRRLPPLRVHANTPFLMGISLQNGKRRLPSFSIEVEDLCEGRLLDKKCYFLKLPAGRTQQTSYRHTLERRGRYVFTGFRVSTKFPFALFRKSRAVDCVSEVLAFPELLPLSHLPASLTQAIGELSEQKKGRRGRFHGLRDYRAGDDRRDIHWKSSARRGRLLVREYEEEAVRQITIHIDNALAKAERRDDRALRQLERIISWAASLCAFYLERGYAVSLCARGPGAALPFSVGTHRLPAFLTLLALLPTVDPEVPFAVPPAQGAAGVAHGAASESLVLVRPGSARPVGVPAGQVVEAA